MANKQRFKILCFTEKKPMSIVELSKELKLAYNKTADYVRTLEEHHLIVKHKIGREVFIKRA